MNTTPTSLKAFRMAASVRAVAVIGPTIFSRRFILGSDRPDAAESETWSIRANARAADSNSSRQTRQCVAGAAPIDLELEIAMSTMSMSELDEQLDRPSRGEPRTALRWRAALTRAWTVG